MDRQLSVIKQDTVQPLLIDGVQLWTDGNYLYLIKHEGFDFGTNSVLKIAINQDNLSVLGGIAGRVKEIPSGIQTVAMSDAKVLKVNLDQNSIYTPSGGIAGQTVVFIVTSTGNYTISFNSPFISSGVRYLSAGETQAIYFEYDGSYWHELASRADIKYPIRNMNFVWVFKMVSIADYATPMVNANPTVTISKDGNQFVSLTGNPTVYEIGYGWYYVTVSAVDMNCNVVILKAIANNSAQTDRVIYL